MKHHLGSALSQLRHEPVPFRLRASHGGTPVLDSTSVSVVWEPRRLVPVHAVPRGDLLVPVEAADPQPDLPDLDALPPMLGPMDFWTHTCPGTVLDLVLPGLVLAGAAFAPDDPDLAGLVVVDHQSLDEWYAEDQPLIGHPHDPFKRIDVLATSRHVRVSLGGVELASSRRATMLVETHLPSRYYLPAEDVATELLVASPTESTCAYKGVASYLSTADGSAAGTDVAWLYVDPLDDAVRVRDHVCFWAERTDLEVDGRAVPRPVTPWSTPEEQSGADPDRLEFG